METKYVIPRTRDMYSREVLALCRPSKQQLAVSVRLFRSTHKQYMGSAAGITISEETGPKAKKAKTRRKTTKSK